MSLIDTFTTMLPFPIIYWAFRILMGGVANLEVKITTNSSHRVNLVRVQFILGQLLESLKHPTSWEKR